MAAVNLKRTGINEGGPFDIPDDPTAGGGLLGGATGAPTAPAAPTGWRPPIVQNFTYPQGLLDQIAQSQQPIQHGGNFGRFQFSQGTPAPMGTPPGWGIQSPQGGYPSPVNWQNRQPQQGGLLGQIMQMMQKARGGYG